MDVNTDLAMWSNQLIISAMIVYAVAMIFYAFDLFGGRELKQSEVGATSAAKPSNVRRTNRKATTALLDPPEVETSAEITTGSGKDKPRRGARIGTSLLVVAINSAMALAARFDSAQLDWGVALAFTVAAVIGVQVGGRVADRLDAERSLRAFAAGLVALALYTAGRAVAALT